MQEDHIFITDDPEFRIEVKGDEDMNILRNPKMIPIQEFYKTEFYNEGKKKKITIKNNPYKNQIEKQMKENIFK